MQDLLREPVSLCRQLATPFAGRLQILGQALIFLLQAEYISIALLHLHG